ncbi:MAG: hypothetical protein WD847_21855 [Pirellulales bacterium]
MHAALLVSVCLLAAAEVAGPDLAGRVLSQDGEPLAGATVFIYTARPKFGTSVYCPSCYADCVKQSKTDDAGNFRIESLDPELLFRVLMVAEGCRPKLTDHLDPAEAPLEIVMEPLPVAPAGQQLRGRVLDPDGKPIVGAIVEPFGIQTAERRWWGAMPGVDPVSVTNLAGQFLITTGQPAEGLDVKVAARGHAKQKFVLLPLGEPHDLTLASGVTVRGRLLRDGRPASGLTVGLVQTDRGAESFVGHELIGTDANGSFEFQNVAAGQTYFIYTNMEGPADLGALPIQRIEVGQDGSVTNLGTLPLGPSYRLAGRVLLTDGRDVPEGTRLMLNREDAWDSQTAILRPDGSFEFRGVPEEGLSLICSIGGYKLATARNRFQELDPRSVGIYVDEDRDGLELHYEPEK